MQMFNELRICGFCLDPADKLDGRQRVKQDRPGYVMIGA